MTTEQTTTERLLALCRSFAVNEIEDCPRCDGSGFEPRDNTSACHQCGGVGEVCLHIPLPQEVRELRSAVDHIAALLAVAGDAMRVADLTKENFPHRSPEWVYDTPNEPIKLAMNKLLESIDKARSAVGNGSKIKEHHDH